jgi:hypothetical protein
VKEQNIESQMLQQQGMANTIKFGARKPCQKECMILDINANLEYADGSPVPNTPDGVGDISIVNGQLITNFIGLVTSRPYSQYGP